MKAIDPHLGAEQSVLGLLMLYPETADKVVYRLNQECFSASAHRKIFNAILNLYERSNPYDILAVADQLGSNENIADIGGRAYICELTEGVGDPANIEYYADILVRYSAKVKLQTIANQILYDSGNGLRDVNSYVGNLNDQLFTLVQQKKTDSIGGEDLMMKIQEDAEYAQKHGGKIGIQIGFPRIDERIVGLLPGNYMIIAGRPSVGKSAFALNMFSHIALNAKLPALYISLEMSAEEIGLRLISSVEDINSRLIITGRVYDKDRSEEATRLSIAQGKISNSYLRIVDTAGLTPIDIMSIVRRNITQHNIKIVFIDYLQKIRGGKRFSGKTEELGYISDHLQVMAKELQIPVVALSQLNRDMERGNRPPVPSDLRGSGDLEQDADFILMLHRERDKGGKLKSETDAYLNKGRNRGEETYYFLFKNKLQRFIPAKLEKDIDKKGNEITNYVPEFDPDDNIPEAVNNYYEEAV